MNTKPTTTAEPIDADLQALADEIAATTGVSPSTALELAAQQRASLQQFAQRWDAATRHASQGTRRLNLGPKRDA